MSSLLLLDVYDWGKFEKILSMRKKCRGLDHRVHRLRHKTVCSLLVLENEEIIILGGGKQWQQ